jgi:hypothetical protein
MDEPKLTAQQRFDLLDMTRFKSYIQEAFADVISDILGAAHHNEAATGFLQKKPLMVKNFNITKVGSPSLQMKVERTWVGGADGTYSAHVYDQNGSRITGPNSPASRNITVAAAPGATTRYLMVRRVATDDTSEARKFYTSSGGHTTTNVNTRTIDDYELQDSTTSADSDATLSSAGWIDIATFQTNGTTDINSGPTALAPSIERALLTWASAPPAADQTIVTVFENIQALVQLMKQIRYGEGSGRTWTDEILNDASFDEEGGIRWGKGDTLGTGKSAVYTRAQGADEVVTDSNATAAALTDLEPHMAGPFLARAADSTYGHTYASAIGSDNPATITREWSYNCSMMTPIGNNAATNHIDPWSAAVNPAANPDTWYLYVDLGAPATGANNQYRMYYNNGTGKMAGLNCAIVLPDLCQIEEISWRVDFQMHLGANGFLKCYTSARDQGGWVVTQTYDYSSGGIFSAGGAGNVVTYSSGSHIHTPSTNNFYQTTLSFYTSGGVPNTATGTLVHVNGVYVKVNIREASYVY